MKVLFQNRPDVFTAWGGDTTQMVHTKEYLEKLGVVVDVSVELEPDVTGYDIVHIFNIQTAEVGALQLRNAKKQGKPVAVSPIYWDLRHLPYDEDVVKFHASPLVRKLASYDWQLTSLILKARRSIDFKAKHCEKSLFDKMYEMLLGADVLLPNSYAESEILSLLFNAPFVRGKNVIVYNGIDAKACDFEVKTRTEDSKLGELPSAYVLAVGRVEPIKGQLKVIRALMSLPEIPLVFIGRSNNLPYSETCKLLGAQRGNTWFIEEVPHDMLHSYYERAKVHVLPSLRESPGLVTLEAAMSGANCVVSHHCPVTEYFDENVWVCDSGRIDSIHSQIMKAWAAPSNTKLRDDILARFTWHHAAKQTLHGYDRLLKASSS